MIRRITLTNYMSHAHTVIEPAEGLTVITGPNNCGKSAIVSALQTLCENGKGDYMVRHGEKESTVTVETSEGHILQWRRKGTSVSYVINGEEIHRVRGSVPDKLHELLRLPAVQTDEDSDSFDIHFGTQKEPIFLLNRPASKAATFFAASSDAARLMEMQRLHKLKVRDATKKQKELGQRRKRLEAELESLDSLPAVEALISTAETVFEQHQLLNVATAELEEFVNQLDREIHDESILSEKLKQLESLQPVPTLHDDHSFEALVHDFDATQQTAVISRSQSSVLQPIASPPQLFDVERAADLCREWQLESRRMSSVTKEGDLLASLAVPPDLPDPNALQVLLDSHVEAMHDFAETSGRCDVLCELEELPRQDNSNLLAELIAELEFEASEEKRSGRVDDLMAALEPPPEQMELRDIGHLLEQVESVERGLRVQQREVRLIVSEMRDLEISVRTWADRNPICRTCGGRVSPERLLGGEHSHG